MLEIKLSDTKIDSFFKILQTKNSELATTQHNLRIKLKASEVQSRYWESEYKTEQEAHTDTHELLEKYKHRLNKVELNLKQSNQNKKTVLLVAGSVVVALIGGIIIASVIK